MSLKEQLEAISKVKSEKNSLELLAAMQKDETTWKFLNDNTLIPHCKMIMKISYQLGYKECAKDIADII